MKGKSTGVHIEVAAAEEGKGAAAPVVVAKATAAAADPAYMKVDSRGGETLELPNPAKGAYITVTNTNLGHKRSSVVHRRFA